MNPHGVFQGRLDNTEVSFAVVVLAAYVDLFASADFAVHPIITPLIIILGLLYLALAIYGGRYVDGKSMALRLSFFGAALLLGGVTVYLSRGQVWLLLLPLAGSAIAYLPRPWAITTCVLIWLLQLLPYGLWYGWSSVVTAAGPFMAAVLFVTAFTQVAVNEQRSRQELSEAHQKLRQYAVKVEELAVAQERNRLAREIHDGLGHYLTAIHIQIKAAQSMLHQDTALTQTALNNAQTLTQEALVDVRRSVSALRADPATNRPLPETLSRLLSETHAAGVQTSLTIEGAPRPLPAPVEFALYRAAQEALTNVRKHARARQVDVHLSYLERSVQLQLRDDGAGAAQTGGGFGLTGLRERVELLNGALHVETAPGQGFRLRVELPTEER